MIQYLIENLGCANCVRTLYGDKYDKMNTVYPFNKFHIDKSSSQKVRSSAGSMLGHRRKRWTALNNNKHDILTQSSAKC